MAERTRLETITAQWRTFAETEAYADLIEFIQTQKEINSIAASGPIEIYRDVETFTGNKELKLDFEPEKLAYLLQRSVGCDIVKTYVEEFTTVESPAS